jgi:Cell Wall Hydrolase
VGALTGAPAQTPMTDYEQWLAALCIWREARGESLAAKTGVWHVIQNRAYDEQRRWPRTVAGVILQHAQFSSFLQSDPNCVRFPIPPIPPQTAPMDWVAFLDCQIVVGSSLNADPTQGANFYESYPEPPDPAKMPWFDPANLTVQIGPIRFYRS